MSDFPPIRPYLLGAVVIALLVFSFTAPFDLKLAFVAGISSLFASATTYGAGILVRKRLKRAGWR